MWVIEYDLVRLQQGCPQEALLAHLSRLVRRVVYIQFTDDIGEDGGSYLNARDLELRILDDVPFRIHAPGSFTGRHCLYAIDHRLRQGYRSRIARIKYQGHIGPGDLHADNRKVAKQRDRHNYRLIRRCATQRASDRIEQLALMILAQLPEHHAAEVMALDVVRLDRDRLGVVVGDERVSRRVPKEGRLCLCIPLADKALLADELIDQLRIRVRGFEAFIRLIETSV